GNIDPTGLEVSAPSLYMIPGSSQNLEAGLLLGWFEPLVIKHGIKWEVSDSSLASIDENGRIVTKSFSGTHTLSVTGHFQSGDLHWQSSLTLTLTDVPQVVSVNMDGLPDELQPISSYPLFTNAQLTAAAGGGVLQVSQAQWSLVDPDAAAAQGVSIGSINGAPYLHTLQPASDITVRLRAVQNIRGFSFTTEKTVVVKKFVLTPVDMTMFCPYYIDYAMPADCTATVIYNNGTMATAVPQLSVSTDDAAYVSVSGSTITSTWDNKSSYRTVQISGMVGALTSTATVSLNPRKTLMTGLELDGLAELADGTSTQLQAWASWDDGSRTNVTSSVRWSSSKANYADFNQYQYGLLMASYILDEPGDKSLMVTASACKYREDYSCADSNRISTSTPVTIRYIPLALTGLRLDAGDVGYGFMQSGKSYALTARAVWNKKLPGGADYSTEVSEGVQWTGNHAGVVVSGSQLSVGSIGGEPLLMLTASYQDPNDSGVVRTARRVITLFSSTGHVRRLDPAEGLNGAAVMLGGDDLVRSLLSASSPFRKVVSDPHPFISDVKQAVRTSQGWAYLRNDGSVWYPEPVSTQVYSAEMREQLTRQASAFDYYDVIPRPIGLLQDIVMLAQTSFTPYTGALFALRSDGWVTRVAIKPLPNGGRGYVLSATGVSGVKRITGGSSLLMLKQDGTVWSRPEDFNDVYTQIMKDAQTPLTGIVDIASLPEGGMALDASGALWTWGRNFYGQLGHGDTVDRQYATRIASVTGFSKITSGLSVALRTDGSLWSWGGYSNADSKEPQRVGAYTGLTGLVRGYVVQANGRVLWWGRDSLTDSLSTPASVYVSAAPGAAALSLP
ncbi:MAG: hypothetical protein REI12_07210, partial [Pedobacter sp.]|nr:hypothetical protein [Pedobacter sp.]